MSENHETAQPEPAPGHVCCARCRRTMAASTLVDHHERSHKRHTVTLEPGELDAVLELIRNRLVTERTTAGSVFAGPRNDRERLLWNFFVRHDKRLRRLWFMLNAVNADVEALAEEEEA